jgi:hypothetical protein
MVVVNLRMVQAIFNIMSSSIITGLICVGAGTMIHKIGSILKTVDEEPKDGYKKAFDKTMIQTVEEFNFCIDSVKLILKTTTKSGLLLTDIVTGNKVVQKDKDGKLYIRERSKLYGQYENTIEELSSKVKQYQEELEKMKKIQELQKKKNITMKKKSYINEHEESDNSEEESTEERIKKDFHLEEEDESDEDFTLETK